MATKPRGLDRLNRQIRALAPTVKARTGERLAQAAAETAEAIARAAPDAKLKASVGSGEGPPPRGSILSGGPITAAGRMKAAAGLLYSVWAGDADAFWARWTEHGTAPHSLTKGADLSRGKRQVGGVQHPGARAQPFFWPTIRARKKDNRREVLKAGRQAAKDIARL